MAAFCPAIGRWKKIYVSAGTSAVTVAAALTWVYKSCRHDPVKMCAQAHCCQSNKMERLLNRVSRRHSRRRGNERASLEVRLREAAFLVPSEAMLLSVRIEAAMVASRRCETKRRRTRRNEEELVGGATNQ